MPEILREKIRVPFCVESALSGVMRTVVDNQRMIYRRKFQVAEAWRGRRIKLIFQAVDYETEVSLNGQLVGGHKGGQRRNTSFTLILLNILILGYDSFHFDITDNLLPGGELQTLTVTVKDPTEKKVC